MKRKGQAGVAIGCLFVVAAIVCLIIGAMGFDKVEANHLGVKVRLGQIIGAMDPGIRWTGILTHTYQYDMRIRKEKVEMQVQPDTVGRDGIVIKGKDEGAVDKTGQAIYGTVHVNYRLKYDSEAVQDLYRKVGTDREIAHKLNLVPIIREGFKQATVGYEAIEILEKRQEVKEEAIKNIRNNFPKEYFEIVDIVVENIDFTDEYKEAINQKKVASQNKLKELENVEVVKYQQQQEIEKYKAEAEKLRLQKKEITPLLVEMEKVKVFREVWSGNYPDTLIINSCGDGGGSAMGMLLQMPQIAKKDNIDTNTEAS